VHVHALDFATAKTLLFKALDQTTQSNCKHFFLILTMSKMTKCLECCWQPVHLRLSLEITRTYSNLNFWWLKNITLLPGLSSKPWTKVNLEETSFSQILESPDGSTKPGFASTCSQQESTPMACTKPFSRWSSILF